MTLVRAKGWNYCLLAPSEEVTLSQSSISSLSLYLDLCQLLEEEKSKTIFTLSLFEPKPQFIVLAKKRSL